MERVTGIGGVFFAAADPGVLEAWYHEHLGVLPTPTSYDAQPWVQQAGATVWGPAGADAEHLAGRSWAINFRVRDLDAMVAQLQGAGIEVYVHPEAYPNGRFAELADPEGNPVQLWQPEGPEADPEAG